MFIEDNKNYQKETLEIIEKEQIQLSDNIKNNNHIIIRLFITYLIQFAILALSILLGINIFIILSIISMLGTTFLYIKVANEIDKLIDKRKDNDEYLQKAITESKKNNKNYQKKLTNEQIKYQYLDNNTSIAIENIRREIMKTKVYKKN